VYEYKKILKEYYGGCLELLFKSQMASNTILIEALFSVRKCLEKETEVETNKARMINSPE